MSLLYFLCPENQSELREIIHAALHRSFTSGLVSFISMAEWQNIITAAQPLALVVVNPLPEWTALIKNSLAIAGSKLLLLGAVPPDLADFLGLRVTQLIATDQLQS